MQRRKAKLSEQQNLWGVCIECPHCLFNGFGWTRQIDERGRQHDTCPECGVSQVFKEEVEE